jgi:hypothetical protein
MNGRTLRDRVVPVLVGGTRRESLPAIAGLDGESSASTLHALSLVG